MSLFKKSLYGAAAGIIGLGLMSCDSNSTPANSEETLVEASLIERAPPGQLPKIATPNHYELNMRVDPREAEFSGTGRIALTLTESTDGFWLHGKDLTVSNVQITSGSETFTGSWEEVLPTGVAWLGFGRALNAGDITVEITYSAKFDERLRGLFKVEEQGDAYALAKSESIQARRFLPGFDEPGYKNPFTINLTIPEEYEAISNGPEVSRTPADPGYVTVAFAETRPLPTYLLSVAVGPFDIVDYAPLPPNAVRSEPIPLRGVARRGRGADIDYALSVTADIIEIFETELGVPYPYKKLDIVAAPQWPSGATELAGAISYRESRILYNPVLGESARRSLLGIHTHEIAHMWFGDLVTPPWWDDLWLKESFATWGTPFSLTAFEPQGGYDLDAVGRALGVMNLDSIASARAIREPIDRNENIRNAYDGITYSKGMAVIRMVDNFFGADTFRPALGEYIKTFEDDIADSAQFFEVIGEVSGEPALTATFQSFVTQSGLPKIDLQLDCAETPRITLTQSQYAPLGSTIEQGKSWAVPVCFVTGSADGQRNETCHLLDQKSVTLDLTSDVCPAWVMPNSGATGYYRWDLEPTAWSALAENFSALSPAEALSSIDSAAAAFKGGGGDANGLLDLLEAAAQSDELNVATAPLGAIADMKRILESDEDKTAFNAYATALYADLYTYLQANGDGKNEIFLTQLTRFLANVAEYQPLRARLAEQAAQFIGFEGRPRNDNLKSGLYGTALTIGVQTLGPDFFDALSIARDEIDDPRFAAAAAGALGRTSDAENVTKVRSYILDGTLGPRETYDLLSGQLETKATRDETWAWTIENYPAIVSQIPGTWPRRTPRLASVFCSADRIGELEALFNEHGDIAPGHERALAETIESLALCDAYKTERQSELAAALRER